MPPLKKLNSSSVSMPKSISYGNDAEGQLMVISCYRYVTDIIGIAYIQVDTLSYWHLTNFTSYSFPQSDFDKLAHGPRGTEASHCLYVYRFFPSDGQMVLLNIAGEAKELINPAFSRFHPR